jgi:hypothetical protein
LARSHSDGAQAQADHIERVKLVDRLAERFVNFGAMCIISAVSFVLIFILKEDPNKLD